MTARLGWLTLRGIEKQSDLRSWLGSKVLGVPQENVSALRSTLSSVTPEQMETVKTKLPQLINILGSVDPARIQRMVSAASGFQKSMESIKKLLPFLIGGGTALGGMYLMNRLLSQQGRQTPQVIRGWRY